MVERPLPAGGGGGGTALTCWGVVGGPPLPAGSGGGELTHTCWGVGVTIPAGGWGNLTHACWEGGGEHDHTVCGRGRSGANMLFEQLIH